MANYFYFDRTNQKYGPIDEQQLHDLAAAGTIRPDTLMETVDGHKGVAKQIPGLRFMARGTSDSTVPGWYATAAITCGIACIVLVLGTLFWERQIHAQELWDQFRWLFWIRLLNDTVFVIGMFFGCRGISTNKAVIAWIGLILCIIAFTIPRLYWALETVGMM